MSQQRNLDSAIEEINAVDLQSYVESFDSISNGKDIPKWFKPFFDSFKIYAAGIVKYTTNLEQQVASLEEKIERNDSLLGVLQTVSDNLLAEKLRLDESVSKLEDKLDDLQQYSRRNCLLVHGIDEKPNEDTTQLALDLFNSNMNVNITLNDITRSHRIGKKTNKKTRPIIVKFLSYRPRKLVYDNKKKLKNTRKLVTESLTKRRFSLLSTCHATFGKSNVWTLDGRIFCKDGDSIIVATREEDIIYQA